MVFNKENKTPRAEDFRLALENIFLMTAGDYVDVNAGELHRAVGGYPGKNHRMPVCCQVMYSCMKTGDKILPNGPPKGKGASLTIRYRLPR